MAPFEGKRIERDGQASLHPSPYLPQRQAARFPHNWLKKRSSLRCPTVIGWTIGCGRVHHEFSFHSFLHSKKIGKKHQTIHVMIIEPYNPTYGSTTGWLLSMVSTLNRPHKPAWTYLPPRCKPLGSGSHMVGFRELSFESSLHSKHNSKNYPNIQLLPIEP